jgi:hypothetical protein
LVILHSIPWYHPMFWVPDDLTHFSNTNWWL